MNILVAQLLCVPVVFSQQNDIEYYYGDYSFEKSDSNDFNWSNLQHPVNPSIPMTTSQTQKNQSPDLDGEMMQQGVDPGMVTVEF